jgi:iron complex transport system substrate-binding protein
MARPPRIVSLLPSATEIVAALGLLEHLVGRSHECDFPPEVERVPVCCRPRIDVSRSSAEIHSQVRASLQTGLSIYDVDLDMLRKLRPDVILTQTLCDVCAVTPEDLEALLTSESNDSPCLLDLRPTTLEQCFGEIHRVAMALHVAERGHDVVIELRRGFEDIRGRAARTGDKPTVVCIEWFDPLMTAGNWVPELVEIAGGRCLGAEPGRHSAWFDWERLLQLDPDVLILMPCGWNLARTRIEATTLTSHPNWHQLSAVRNGKVYLTDGHQFFNRPGPRLLTSAEILMEILHPESRSGRHRGTNWEKL